jgi:hypothetical protein
MAAERLIALSSSVSVDQLQKALANAYSDLVVSPPRDARWDR